MLRPKQLLAAALIFLFAGIALGQNREKVGDNKVKIKYLAPTIEGTTGLFQLPVADTLRQGEFSLGLNGYEFHREPGQLDFTIFPATVTIGLLDRLEIFASWGYKRVDADAIAVNKINGQTAPLLPARLSSGIWAIYNDTPFMDVGFGDGPSEITAGLKLNIISERRGSPFGVAVMPIARFHTTDDREVLARGLTSGATDYGADLVISKDLPRQATLTGKAGVLVAQDHFGIDRQNRFNWGAGAAVPLTTLKVQLIGELVGSTFFGDKGLTGYYPTVTVPIVENPVSPIDVNVGLRVFPSKWFTLSGGYKGNLRTINSGVYGIPATGRNGWIAQLAFQRKVDRPPVVECSAEKTTVIEGESVAIHATATDPDNDYLTITWKASGGRLTSTDSTATLDTTGLKPGQYSVTVDVSDNEKTATCTAMITVEKHKLPPTINCQDPNQEVMEGNSITLTASASDPNNDEITYSWKVDGQPVTDNQPTFVFGTAGRTVGEHKVEVTATDVDGMTASCEFTVTITPKPKQPPTVTLTLNKTEVYAGETVVATAKGYDPEGGPLTYAWKVDGTPRSETGNVLDINTSGFAGGSHSVTVTVTDEQGLSASDTKSFSVRVKITIEINRTKPNNVAKAKLDEIALKMQQNPNLKAIITGYSDNRGSQKAIQRASERRAEAAKDYLVKQHNIDPSRIETKGAGDSNPIASNDTAEGRKENRRIEVELYVP